MNQDYKVEQIDNKETELTKVPIYMEVLELSKDEKECILKQCVEQLTDLKEKRNSEGWDSKWDILDAYYFLEDIQLEGYTDIFQLHMPTARIKNDSIVWACQQAFFDSEKKFSCSPRASFAKQEGADVICKQQEDWLNYKFDVLPLESEYGLILHSTVWKGTGIGKWFHEIDYEDRVREERYTPDMEDFLMPDGKIEKRDNNKCADRFKRNHFKRMKDADQEADFYRLYKDLLKGKEITLRVEYLEMIYNDPMLSYVDLKNFYVYLNCKKNQGLKKHTTYERLFFTYEELKDKEREDEFFDIDELTKDKDGKKEKGFRTEEYKIIMATGYFYTDKDSDERKRMIIWYDEDKEIIVGSVSYPFVAIPSPYVLHYIEEKRTGVYEDGIGLSEIDMNIGQDILLNFSLDAFYRENADVPIVSEGSELARQFINKRYRNGVPIELPEGEKIDFMSNYRKNSFDVERAVMLIQMLGKNIDDSTGVSGLVTGGESQLDPSAPAAKTMMLLEQSGANVKKYIKTLLKSFNISANVLIRLYAQIDDEYGNVYRPEMSDVVGEPNPFRSLSREVQLADTRIECQAYNFDFEKLNFNKMLLALKQILDQEPMFRQNPEAVREMLSLIIKSWNPMVANKIDLLLPAPEKFKQQMIEQAVQGVDQYLQIMDQKSKIDGLPPKYDFQQLQGVVQQFVQQLVNQPKEEKK